jgi:hypothetical protein
MLEVTPGDLRRAAALICHHGHKDAEGADAIILEANESDRIAELLLGVLTVYRNLVPLLHTEAGFMVLQRTITEMAAREEGEQQ